MAENRVFVPYQVVSKYSDRKHPAEIVETASLASIKLIEPHYDHSIPDCIVHKKTGSLSGVQMDAILFAGQAHCKSLNGTKAVRRGFLIGDGTGVGKGRELAGIILDNEQKGRKKHLWLSCSPLLIEDAQRDIKYLLRPMKNNPECPEINVFPLPSEYRKINATSGVLFCTYSSLGSHKGITTKNEGQFESRLEQILDWVGGSDFTGVMIFDEAHKAKGYTDDDNLKSSIVGDAVVKLQKKCPGARVIYVSATFASNIRDMLFMERLGLWGTKYTSFNTAGSFFDFVEEKGIAGYEVAACEMKSRGMCISRHLSFSGCTFELVKTTSSPQFTDLYRKCSELWINIIQICPASKSSIMWASAQKFFRALCVATKMPELLNQIKTAREQNMSVVVGLQSTGEAAYKRFCKSPYHDETDLFSPCQAHLEQLLLQRGSKRSADGFEFSAVDLGLRLKRTQAPSKNAIVQLGKRKKFNAGVMKKRKLKLTDDESDTDSENDVLDIEVSDDDTTDSEGLSMFDSETEENPAPARNSKQEAREKICTLYKEISHLLPLNPIDVICAEFGDGNVSEMTGRLSVQVLRKTENGYAAVCQMNRAKTKVTNPIKIAHSAFQAGLKKIAIISDAASTGISLHSDKKCGNKEQRIHIILESPWSAMNTSQQIGRTNRSNQVQSPKYVVLMSDVPGEKRFATALAGRMGSLGALCKGDRNSSLGNLWNEYDIPARVSKKAIKELTNNIAGGESNLVFFHKTKEEEERNRLLTSLCLLKIVAKNEKGVYKTFPAVTSHEKFTNRLLCLNMQTQGRLFSYLDEAIDYVWTLIRQNLYPNPGYDSIEELSDKVGCTFEEVECIIYNLNSQVSSRLISFRKTDILSWEEAKMEIEKRRNQKQQPRFYGKTFDTGRTKVYLTFKAEPGSSRQCVFRASSKSYVEKTMQHILRAGFQKISVEEAKLNWNLAHQAFREGKCSNWIKSDRSCSMICEHKIPTLKFGVVVGGLLSVWDNLSNILDSTKFVRHLIEGRNLLGIYVPGSKIENAKIVLHKLCQVKT